MKLDNIHSIYFVGIGGIGMSALARYFHGRGVKVAGYDRTETTLTKTLVSEGIEVRYTAEVATLPQDVDLVGERFGLAPKNERQFEPKFLF